MQEALNPKVVADERTEGVEGLSVSTTRAASAPPGGYKLPVQPATTPAQAMTWRASASAAVAAISAQGRSPGDG